MNPSPWRRGPPREKLKEEVSSVVFPERGPGNDTTWKKSQMLCPYHGREDVLGQVWFNDERRSRRLYPLKRSKECNPSEEVLKLFHQSEEVRKETQMNPMNESV
ncbi:hypothetical protein TcasGA2_TC013910 [Tribolium castaneum]|uniref:Uncharacterized protein n=1 Tax=Tribolium castaneum TaxID=7070 RepID=D6WMQ8_TRICA|nr:hypothetical protein TcasGA2_TC013910 [Tribolium castaneum]